MKKFSHSIITKFIVFVVAVLCLLGAIEAVVKEDIFYYDYLSSITEDDYLESQVHLNDIENVIWDLTSLLGEYKSEEHILNGGTISESEWRWIKEGLLEDYQVIGKYDYELSREENFENLQKEYPEKITGAREALINEDLREYHLLLRNIDLYEGLFFYATDGANVFANTNMNKKEQFETFPAYLIFHEFNLEVYPEESPKHNHFNYLILDQISIQDLENTEIYLSFTKEYLNEKAEKWQSNKEVATKNLLVTIGFTIGFLISFIYLVLLIGRDSFQDKEVHLHLGDKIYNDISIALATAIIVIYADFVDYTFDNITKIIVPVMLPIIIISLYVILTLVKHIKNKTLFKHTLIYKLIHKLVQFILEVYRSGSVAVKTVLIVIGYPILIALTFFMFPVTIGIAAWFTLKKVKSFQAIQEGVEKIKDGDLHHRIKINREGEFKDLADNINCITDGLNKAMENELKSERLKTELITNVSHDIRTPLTSIITYVDLLKHEEDPAKIKEYVEVLNQKSKRLKMLTDDLFEASKATSGNIPIQLEKIDIVSLINQGLGEVSDKIEELDLDFRMNFPEQKIFIRADGRLLWRSIENLLSNIFKYSLKGSRVYISVEDVGNECLLTFKNISAHELNISAEELMERFKRGDESRTTQGSGLGLSIAQSLIELQKGKFQIEIDGDLFKAIIYLPKHNRDEI